MNIIVGTAGHIDHGKTSLVKALTGTDTDRLPEEKKRGITIDIGFAELSDGDLHIGFVDVPGHERFIKNMLAGASGIDLVLMTVAADEGVMPQTREHFEICRLLGIPAGVIAITKADMADDGLLDIVRAEVGELVQDSFLECAPIFAVSARTGEGIDDLKKGLTDAARNAPARVDKFVPRLPIDRSFAVHGFGAVVTGTLSSGQIKESDELELLPAGKRVRVRGVQTHGRPVSTAYAGQRTALNLGGIDRHELSRGMVLSKPGTLRTTQIVDTKIEVLRSSPGPLRTRQRVRVHIGTLEALARCSVLNEIGEIEPGRTGFVQLRLETPLAVIPGERFIIRSYSPQTTIAGGTIVTNFARRVRRREASGSVLILKKLSAAKDAVAEIRLLVRDAGNTGTTRDDLQARTGFCDRVLDEAIRENREHGEVFDTGGILLALDAFDELKKRTITAIEEHHKQEPLSRGIGREKLREAVFKQTPAEVFRAILTNLETEGKIKFDRDAISLASHSADLSPPERTALQHLKKIYDSARLEVPSLTDALEDASRASGLKFEAVRKVFQLLVDRGELKPVTPDMYFSSEEIRALTDRIRSASDGAPDRSIDVASFKNLAGVSRKYAIPLLEYFDRERVTQRVGDKRVVLK